MPRAWAGWRRLITFPQVQTHADIEPETCKRLGINDVLLRLSVGIEDTDDLIADLAQAFEEINHRISCMSKIDER